MSTVIIKCKSGCKNEFQDNEYNARVMNKTAKGDEATCTVCGVVNKIGQTKGKK